MIRLNKKFIDANQHRMNKQNHKRDHELKRMEDAVHAQARRMEVKLTPEAAQELVSRLYDKSMDGMGYDKLRSRVTDAVGALRDRHFSRHPQHHHQHHHPQHPQQPHYQHLDNLTTQSHPIATDHSLISAHQPEIGGMSVFLPIPLPPSLPGNDPASAASVMTTKPSLLNRQPLMKSNNGHSNKTIDLDDFLFDDEGCYVEANEDVSKLLSGGPATVGPADGVFDDNFLLSYPVQPKGQTGSFSEANHSLLNHICSHANRRLSAITFSHFQPFPRCYLLVIIA